VYITILMLFPGFFERRDSVISERYEMFASTLNENFRFAHTFSDDVLQHYGYKKFVYHIVLLLRVSTAFA